MSDFETKVKDGMRGEVIVGFLPSSNTVEVKVLPYSPGHQEGSLAVDSPELLDDLAETCKFYADQLRKRIAKHTKEVNEKNS